MLILSPRRKQRIEELLTSLPAKMGKIIVTIELGCGTGGKLNTMKLKYFTEEEVPE